MGADKIALVLIALVMGAAILYRRSPAKEKINSAEVPPENDATQTGGSSYTTYNQPRFARGMIYGYPLPQRASLPISRAIASAHCEE